MRRQLPPTTRQGSFVGRRVRAAGWLFAALAAPGCGREAEVDYTSAARPPAVQVIHPPLRTIVRVVEQPSFIESYERTSVYPKMTAYIEKWVVDIGDKVKKGDLLATLFVPELVEDFGTKKATVELDRQEVELALKMLDVTRANVEWAAARVSAVQAELDRYQAEVDRWDTEVKRLTRESQRGVVSPQILLESTNQLKSNTASRDSVKADIVAAQAELLSKKADDAKARVAVDVARAREAVAQSEARRLKAWVDYLTLTAPFDGVIVARNANTFDFVLPATGDPTAMQRAPDISPAGAAPIYVVDRLDVVRIFVDVPEEDANFVQVGSRAKILARAFRDQEISGTVTRTSWALNVKSRTLRAEIDLPNPDSKLLPGMYAYARLPIERKGVRALPVAALIYVGDRTYFLQHQNGRAVRTEIQTGVSDGEWIEVLNRRTTLAANDPPDDSTWAPLDGSEQVILGDLSILADGTPVEVVAPSRTEKVASITRPRDPGREDSMPAGPARPR